MFFITLYVIAFAFGALCGWWFGYEVSHAMPEPPEWRDEWRQYDQEA